MTKLSKEYLRPEFKTSREKLKDFFDQSKYWSGFLGKEIDFTTFEVLRSEFTTWRIANKKPLNAGRKKGSKDSYKRKAKEGVKLGRPKKVE
jgi:hypothetical protein